MPYKNPKQAQAAFISIARKQGMTAAKRFGSRHKDDLSAAASGPKPYRARRRRRSQEEDV